MLSDSSRDSLPQVSKSDKEVVSLRNVSLESSGRYKCEVLAESPKFMTLLKSEEMQAVGELMHGELQPAGSGWVNAWRVGELQPAGSG